MNSFIILLLLNNLLGGGRKEIFIRYRFQKQFNQKKIMAFLGRFLAPIPNLWLAEINFSSWFIVSSRINSQTLQNI